MTTILNLLILGIIAGAVASFWTRILRPNMIFRRLGKYLDKLNNRHVMENAYDSMVLKFVRCAFCLSPWLVFLFSTWYVLTYHPNVSDTLIGVAGALGAGNFIVELVNVFRSEEV